MLFCALVECKVRVPDARLLLQLICNSHLKTLYMVGVGGMASGTGKKKSAGMHWRRKHCMVVMALLTVELLGCLYSSMIVQAPHADCLTVGLMTEVWRRLVVWLLVKAACCTLYVAVQLLGKKG